MMLIARAALCSCGPMMLDVLFKIKDEQDHSVNFRRSCRCATTDSPGSKRPRLCGCGGRALCLLAELQRDLRIDPRWARSLRSVGSGHRPSSGTFSVAASAPRAPSGCGCAKGFGRMRLHQVAAAAEDSTLNGGRLLRVPLRARREGICGSCAMNIDGTNGLACLTKVRLWAPVLNVLWWRLPDFRASHPLSSPSLLRICLGESLLQESGGPGMLQSYRQHLGWQPVANMLAWICGTVELRKALYLLACL